MESPSRLKGGEFTVQARSVIRVGYKCRVHFHGRRDNKSYVYGIGTNGHTAEVVDVNQEQHQLDIKMTSGPRDGEVLKDFKPKFLFFEHFIKRGSK